MASTPPRFNLLTPDLLARPARYAARVIARERLRRTLEATPARLEPPGDDALHDFRVALRRLRTWLRAFHPQLDETVGRGTLRRLRRLSRRTARARDLEVQLAWLAQPTVRLGPLAARAAGALADRVRAEYVDALAVAFALVAGELPRAGSKLDRQLRQYEVKVRLDASREDPSMAVVTGRLLRDGAALVRTTLDEATSADHAVEAHRARLAVKHLRYLLESLGGSPRGVAGAVLRLAALQDALGLLHDRHVLLVRVAREMAAHGRSRVLTSLQAALHRAAESEFRRARRLADGLGTAAVLRTVDRVATLLSGEAPPRVETPAPADEVPQATGPDDLPPPAAEPQPETALASVGQF